MDALAFGIHIESRYPPNTAQGRLLYTQHKVRIELCSRTEYRFTPKP